MTVPTGSPPPRPRPMIVVLEAHQYDEQGWLLGRWSLVVELDGWFWQYSEWWAWQATMLRARIVDDLATEGYEIDESRLVWWVRPPAEQWPDQPVTLPLGSARCCS